MAGDRVRGLSVRPTLVLGLVLCGAATVSLGGGRCTARERIVTQTATELGVECIEGIAAHLEYDALSLKSGQFRRNPAGSELIVLLKKTAVIIDSNGVVAVVQRRGRISWMNSRHEWEAWCEGSVLFFGSGKSLVTERACAARFSADARYFSLPENGTNSIRRSEQPAVSLAVVDGLVYGIFESIARQRLYVAVRDAGDVGLVAFILSEDGGVVLESRTTIPRPVNERRSARFLVADMDAESGTVLLLAGHDPPMSFRSRAYEYDTHSSDYRELGAFSGGQYLYLRGDLSQQLRAWAQ